MKSSLCFSWSHVVSCLKAISVLFDRLWPSVKCDLQSFVGPLDILFKHAVCLLQLFLAQDFIVLDSRPTNLVCTSFCNIYWNDVVKGCESQLLPSWHAALSNWEILLRRKESKTPKKTQSCCWDRLFQEQGFGSRFILFYLSRKQLFLFHYTWISRNFHILQIFFSICLTVET